MLALFLVGLSTNDLKAQEDKTYKFNVKTNPLAALWGPIPLTGEYKIWFETTTFGKQSLQLGASYLGPSLLINVVEITDTVAPISINGFRAQFMYKFFLTSGGNGPEGFYLAPNVSYASAKLKNKENTNDTIKGTKLNLNGLIGYQLITSGGFALDIYTGFGYKMRDYTFNLDNSELDIPELRETDKMTVLFGIAFGYAF